MRSGIVEFRNNRNFLTAEFWEEFFDGTLMKKIVSDNGYGLKTMKQTGQKLDIDKIGKIKKETDDNKFFKCFIDEVGNKYHSLKELIENSEGFLCFTYQNETIENLPEDLVTMTKKGEDLNNGEKWDNLRIVNKKEDTENVTNSASSPEGEWTENWKRVGLERWVEKSGKKDRMQWNEKWYKRVFGLSKKKDEIGNELDGYESEGSVIEECSCEKWGKNEEANEEWNEKWGETHQQGNKKKWCDKWQMEISSGTKKGENWGQTYNDEYAMKEHWAEKWDQRYPENNGVYEKRFEKYD